MKGKLALFMAILMVFTAFLFGCANKDVDISTDDGSGTSAVTDDDSSESVDESGGDDGQNTEEISQGDADKNTEKAETDKKTEEKKPQSNGNSSSNNNSSGNSGNTGESGSNGSGSASQEQTKPADSMNWPSNEYTSIVPRPSKGTVKKVDTKDGIYCLLLTGADMVDAKTYAASLINYGYTSEVTETIEDNQYLFGGGNSSGAFVVVSYQNGQFIIGIQK